MQERMYCSTAWGSTQISVENTFVFHKWRSSKYFRSHSQTAELLHVKRTMASRPAHLTEYYNNIIQLINFYDLTWWRWWRIKKKRENKKARKKAERRRGGLAWKKKKRLRSDQAWIILPVQLLLCTRLDSPDRKDLRYLKHQNIYKYYWMFVFFWSNICPDVAFSSQFKILRPFNII